MKSASGIPLRNFFISGAALLINASKDILKNWKSSFKVSKDENRVKLKEIANFEYGFTATALEKGEYRLIRITDIDEYGEITNDSIKYVDLNKEESRFILKVNDILVSRTGATYGKTTIFERKEKAVFASYLIKIIFDQAVMLPKYYWYFSQSSYYWEQAKKLVSGTGQPQFNANVLKEINVFVPSLEKQAQLIEDLEIERKLFGSQKKIVNLFQNKVKDRLNSLWESQ